MQSNIPKLIQEKKLKKKKEIKKEEEVVENVYSGQEAIKTKSVESLFNCISIVFEMPEHLEEGIHYMLVKKSTWNNAAERYRYKY